MLLSRPLTRKKLVGICPEGGAMDKAERASAQDATDRDAINQKPHLDPQIETLAPERLAGARFAYTTRRVEKGRITSLLLSEKRPRAGDLVLAKVTKLGQHEHIELPDGRKAVLYPGTEIVVAYGNRYAPDQFEAIVPERLGPCHLVAAGGIASQMLSKHTKMRNPTEILPVGMLGDSDGNRINLDAFGLPEAKPNPLARRPLTILVAGTSMNSGKTTIMSNLAKGLVWAGHKVAAAKLSGTGAGGDRWRILDAGADPVLDFVDAGAASTYYLPADRVERITGTILAELFRSTADFVLLEVSDGLLEPETSRLLTSTMLRPFLDAVMFTAVDAMGATAGVAWLRAHNLPIIGISGVLTNSPLAMREVTATAEIPVYTSESLVKGDVIGAIEACVARNAEAQAEEKQKKD